MAAKKLYVSTTRAAEILDVTPNHVTVLARKYPDEFAPVVLRENVCYFQAKVIEKFKKSGRLQLNHRRPIAKELWI